MSSKKYKYWLS